MNWSIRGAVVAVTLLLAVPAMVRAADIVHDAEYYVLEAQNAEKWSADDQRVDQKLADSPPRSAPGEARSSCALSGAT
jgi:hypothetical protein